MCGIAGGLGWTKSIDMASVGRMTHALAHRGPDGQGVVTHAPVVFGHRRLAVIDLSENAAQPMWDIDARFLLTFNGEIYNYRDLRTELSSLGARFRSHSDTEVILEAYKVWGIRALDRLEGMFAFALWDENEQHLILARDRMGEKPLYWRDTGDGVIFSSQLKSLRLYPSVPNTIDRSALRSLLSIGYSCGPDTIVSGISKLPAASFALFKKGMAPRVETYWDIAQHFHSKKVYGGIGQAADELLDLLDKAVRQRMVSDVPLGAFLSGGIDSATIAASMKATTGPSRPPLTFSIGFDESGFDESVQARESAGYIGTDHSDKIVHMDTARQLPGIVSLLNEPLADTSLLPMYELSAFTRIRTTVALSGDGADELFAGYPTYKADALRQICGGLPSPIQRFMRGAMGHLKADTGKVSLRYKLRQFLENVHLPEERAHYAWRQILPEHDVAQLMGDTHANTRDPFEPFADAFEKVRGADLLDATSYVDLKTWLVDDILAKVDSASMAHSLEVRTPFLDHKIVEFAAHLPSEYKMQGMKQKRVLRASQEKRLHKAILQRRKAGFNAPVSRWFETALSEHFDRVVLNGPVAEHLDIGVAKRIRDDHLARRRDYGIALFAMTVLGIWLEQDRLVPSA